MANKLYEETDVQAIANAIRSKNGSSDTYKVSEMAQAVLDIPQGTTPTGTKQVTIDSAGTTTENVSAYANAEITVPQGQYKPNIDATPTNPSISVSNSGLITAEVMTQYVNDLLKPSFTEGYVKSSDVSMKVKIGGSATHQLTTVNGQTVTPTTSTQYIAVQGDYVLGAINVAPIPSQYIIPTGTKSISANGTGIDVKAYEYVDVSVSGGSADLDKMIDGTLTSVSSSVTSVRGNAFRGLTSLASIDFPNATTVNGSAFYGCSGLTGTISLPSATIVGQNAFTNCTNITTVVLPKVTSTFNQIFNGCTKLKTFDMLGSNSITTQNFNGDTLLDTLIIRKTGSIVSLSNVNAFNGTKFASGGSGGTIYVPNALINTYKSATNWSTLNGYGTVTWKSIENSAYENYYADGTPVS